MKIKISEFEVYESGSVISPNGRPIEFFFPNFSVEIVFETTEDTKDIAINFEIAEKKLIVRLRNFSNSLGTENLGPINVGTLEGKDLFLQFRVYAMDNGHNKLFHYTWLTKEKEVANG